MVGVLLDRGRMVSNAPFARLLEWIGGAREQSAIGVCFRDGERFERDRPSWLLYVSTERTTKRCASPLSEIDLERKAHEGLDAATWSCGLLMGAVSKYERSLVR